ncbi:MAG: hypothetical protein FJ098_16770, partial [Deltaproteobacteria bacterium]|nr:hypothetical protein [Deltaproteobacteria bacterium]
VCGQGASQGCNNCGTQSCTAGCQWGTCSIGPVDNYEENDSEGAAKVLAGITDNDSDTRTAQANINPAYDHDWFRIHIDDNTGYQIDPWFSLSNVAAGQQYQLCVVYDCDASGGVYSKCTTVTGNGSVSLDVADCEDFWSGDDDSGQATIHITPLTSGSCSNYTLQIGA